MLLKHGFANSSKIGKTFSIIDDIDRLMEAIEDAEQIMGSAKKCPLKVYIYGKDEENLLFKFSLGLHHTEKGRASLPRSKL